MIGPIEVFGVTPFSVQVIWRRLSAGSTVEVADQATVVPADEIVGGWQVNGLPPDTDVHVRVNGRVIAAARTLSTPGPITAKVATISDLHLGEESFAFLPRLRVPARNHADLCFQAALTEIVAWQPDMLIVKGDIAHRPTPVAYDRFAQAIADSGLRTVILAGNHDGGNHHGVSMVDALARVGLELTPDLAVVDLPNLRVIGANSMIVGTGAGGMTADDDVLQAASEAAGGVLLATHHQFMKHNVVTYWPPGIPARHGLPFLNRLADAHPNTVVTSGHTHRHRARRHGPLLLSEVGSTKDFPGAWAGYMAGPDGIVQSVRRICAPAALHWTESTRSALLGVWGQWSAGTLADRSFLHHWA